MPIRYSISVICNFLFGALRRFGSRPKRLTQGLASQPLVRERRHSSSERSISITPNIPLLALTTPRVSLLPPQSETPSSQPLACTHDRFDVGSIDETLAIQSKDQLYPRVRQEKAAAREAQPQPIDQTFRPSPVANCSCRIFRTSKTPTRRCISSHGLPGLFCKGSFHRSLRELASSQRGANTHLSRRQGSSRCGVDVIASVSVR